jgi:hypothetical protein
MVHALAIRLGISVLVLAVLQYAYILWGNEEMGPVAFVLVPARDHACAAFGELGAAITRLGEILGVGWAAFLERVRPGEFFRGAGQVLWALFRLFFSWTCALPDRVRVWEKWTDEQVRAVIENIIGLLVTIMLFGAMIYGMILEARKHDEREMARMFPGPRNPPPQPQIHTRGRQGAQ